MRGVTRANSHTQPTPTHKMWCSCTVSTHKCLTSLDAVEVAKWLGLSVALYLSASVARISRTPSFLPARNSVIAMPVVRQSSGQRRWFTHLQIRSKARCGSFSTVTVKDVARTVAFLGSADERASSPKKSPER
jgi:hypothetical protein